MYILVSEYSMLYSVVCGYATRAYSCEGMLSVSVNYSEGSLAGRLGRSYLFSGMGSAFRSDLGCLVGSMGICTCLSDVASLGAVRLRG